MADGLDCLMIHFPPELVAHVAVMPLKLNTSPQIYVFLYSFVGS